MVKYWNLVKLIFVTIICLFQTNLCSQSILELIPDSATDITSFVPEKWEIIDSVICDFNKDNLIDYAFVIQKISPDTIDVESNYPEIYYPKCLVIAYSSKCGTYYVSVKTNKIFGASNWGLQGGDAFGSIGKRNNTLKITFFTGGSLRTIPTYYFRFQNQNWYLIGCTYEEFEVPVIYTEIEDYNLITGVRKDYKETIDGKKTEMKIFNFKIQPLIQLIDFDASNAFVRWMK